MTADDTPPLVTVEHVHFRRGSRVIFEDLSLTLPRGQITAILGPSGTGKTTLLRLIGGQVQPDAGCVRFDGQDVHTLTPPALCALRKRMGMLFQSGALLTDLSVFENVAFPLREHTRLPAPILQTLTLMKLEAVGLRGAQNLMPHQLSGGMARRVALARAIALDPELMMYDEPFAGQDPLSMGVLTRLIRTLNDALCATSLIVSHDVKETFAIANYAYLMAGGRLIESGTPSALQQSTSPWTHQFLRGLPDGPVPFHYPVAPWTSAKP